MKTKDKLLELSDKWCAFLASKGKTGMGYQVVSVIKKNGVRYDQVIVDSGYITRIRGISNIPFTNEDIDEIIVTHDKWNWQSETSQPSDPPDKK